MKKYNIEGCYGIGVVFESDNVDEIIDKMKELEGGDYSSHLDYRQWCADNYERPADYYPTYYINYGDKSYDISELEVFRREANADNQER